MQPWQLLADPSGYIFTWLLGYSGGLGSIAGVLIADYWIVRRTQAARSRISICADGDRTRGWNWRAIAATRARLRARLGRPRRPGAASRSTTTPGSSASASPRSRISLLMKVFRPRDLVDAEPAVA